MMEIGYGITEGDMIKEDKSESPGVVLPDSESTDFGDKDFTMTWSGKSPIKEFYRFEHALSEFEVDKLYRSGCLYITTKTKARELNKINWYLNGYKVPWWAKGSLLLRWWYKRLEKKLSKEDVQGSKEKGK